MAMSPLSQVCMLLIWILQLAGISEALVPAQPSPTPPNWDVDHMGDGWSPRPTGSPFYNLAIALEQDSLARRQVANIHTCGFIDGNADDPITCEAGHGCKTFGADPANFQCLELASSGGTKLSASNIHSGSLKGCNSYGGSFSTWDASYNLIGTISLHLWCQSNYPQCTTVYLHGPASESDQIFVSYGCAQQAAVTTAFWAPTTPGGVIAKPTSSSILLPSSSSVPQTSTSSVSISTKDRATISTGNAASPASASPSGKSKPHSHDDTAAIAGGVVGGVAGFALGFGAIAYVLWRRKKAAKVGEMRELEPDWHTSNEVSSMSMAGTR